MLALKDIPMMIRRKSDEFRLSLSEPLQRVSRPDGAYQPQSWFGSLSVGRLIKTQALGSLILALWMIVVWAKFQNSDFMTMQWSMIKALGYEGIVAISCALIGLWSVITVPCVLGMLHCIVRMIRSPQARKLVDVRQILRSVFIVALMMSALGGFLATFHAWSAQWKFISTLAVAFELTLIFVYFDLIALVLRELKRPAFELDLQEQWRQFEAQKEQFEIKHALASMATKSVQGPSRGSKTRL